MSGEIIDRDKMEELLYAIQNAAHTEYHLLEVHEKNHTKGDLTGFISKARETRRVLMDELLNMFEENGVGAIWCVIKHACLLHFHLLELYEKDYEPVYIEQAQSVYLMINDLLKTKYEDYSNCARCDGDKEPKKYSTPGVYLREIDHTSLNGEVIDASSGDQLPRGKLN